MWRRPRFRSATWTCQGSVTDTPRTPARPLGSAVASTSRRPRDIHMLRLLAMLVASPAALGSTPMKLPILEPGCDKGSSYVNSPSYGVSSSQWGHLPRGGWRGAVLGPHGDKIYGIPTNATSVRTHASARSA
jgi:hypothetical protein